jgi:hypothetical protein
MPAELKSLQEVITLVIFPGFTALYFREPLTLIQRAGFAANWSRRGSGVPGAVLSREETETSARPPPASTILADGEEGHAGPMNYAKL